MTSILPSGVAVVVDCFLATKKVFSLTMKIKLFKDTNAYLIHPSLVSGILLFYLRWRPSNMGKYNVLATADAYLFLLKKRRKSKLLACSLYEENLQSKIGG